MASTAIPRGFPTVRAGPLANPAALQSALAFIKWHEAAQAPASQVAAAPFSVTATATATFASSFQLLDPGGMNLALPILEALGKPSSPVYSAFRTAISLLTSQAPASSVQASPASVTATGTATFASSFQQLDVGVDLTAPLRRLGLPVPQTPAALARFSSARTAQYVLSTQAPASSVQTAALSVVATSSATFGEGATDAGDLSVTGTATATFGGTNSTVQAGLTAAATATATFAGASTATADLSASGLAVANLLTSESLTIVLPAFGASGGGEMGGGTTMEAAVKRRERRQRQEDHDLEALIPAIMRYLAEEGWI